MSLAALRQEWQQRGGQAKELARARGFIDTWAEVEDIAGWVVGQFESP